MTAVCSLSDHCNCYNIQLDKTKWQERAEFSAAEGYLGAKLTSQAFKKILRSAVKVGV